MPKKGKKMTAAARAKLAAYRRGRTHTRATKKKIAAAMRGNLHAAGHRVTKRQRANLKQGAKRGRA